RVCLGAAEVYGGLYSSIYACKSCGCRPLLQVGVRDVLEQSGDGGFQMRRGVRPPRISHKGMGMMPRIWFVVCLVAMAVEVATAQSSAGNIVTGEAKVDLISSYTGSDSLPKPESVIIRDFTPVGDVITDESVAGRLHRNLSRLHGSDEDSS